MQFKGHGLKNFLSNVIILFYLLLNDQERKQNFTNKGPKYSAAIENSLEMATPLSVSTELMTPSVINAEFTYLPFPKSHMSLLT